MYTFPMFLTVLLIIILLVVAILDINKHKYSDIFQLDNDKDNNKDKDKDEHKDIN